MDERAEGETGAHGAGPAKGLREGADAMAVVGGPATAGQGTEGGVARPAASASAGVDVEAALERYESALLRYATHLIGDEERARDVVQDVFLDLCRTPPPEGPERLAPWLYAVCRHRAIDSLRKERRMVALTSEAATEAVAVDLPPQLAVEQHDTHHRVLAVLGTLPANQQEVVRLKFLGELSYREISEVTGLSESNVGYLIHMAIRSLRARMRAEAAEV